MRTLDLIAAGKPPAFAEQDEAGVTYAEKIGPEDRLLDPARPASELERVVRALHPHIGARVALADGTLLGVHRARVAEIQRSTAIRGREQPGQLRHAGGTRDGAAGRLLLADAARRARAARGSAAGRTLRWMRPPTCVAMPAKARACAYAVLRRVFEDGAYADRALHGEAKQLDARDRALAMRLVYGTVQRKGTLDYLIERLAERPPEKLDARLLAALRLGLYELLYLSGAPDHAVVADAVELAKGGARGGHGLVNAVLRRGAREGPALLDGLSDETPAQAAVKHSHPGVDRAAVVGTAGGERRPRAAGLRQRARRGGAAREHAAHRCRDARGRAAGGNPYRPGTARGARAGGPVRRARLASVARRGVPGAVARARCASRACSIPSRASGCSTCARRPAARAPIWRR